MIAIMAHPESPSQYDPATCLPCRIAVELNDHRDDNAAEWSVRRATLNFAIIIAKRHCPAYQAAWAVDA